MTWQPIKTVPTSGVVDLFVAWPFFRNNGFKGFRYTDCYRRLDGSWTSKNFDSEKQQSIKSPTHWMVIPAAPKLQSIDESCVVKKFLAEPGIGELVQSIKSFQLAQFGEPGMRVVASLLDLEHQLEYFIDNNKSTAEYHSVYHSFCVALNAYEGAHYQKLSYNDTRALVAAAIFHDFNHRGITAQDEINIEIASAGLKASGYSDQGQADQILRVTKYPYDRDPDTMMEMIIRDADLMQPYEQDAVLLRTQYCGLQIEIERTRGLTYTTQEFSDGQQAWLRENVKWYSPWAILKAKTVDWDATLRRLYETMNGA